ncbi:hypothetical protein JXA88_16980, partial [Candidatus Fermentibacteria bacterium]|nr:hypothetical protein [Candidatus Fermentibacteria bacterium]
MDKKLKTGILALLAVLCLMIVASFAYAQGAVAYFEATLGMGGSLGESGPLGSCGLEGEVCDETLACCEGLFCSPGIVYSALYYDDVVKHCCPSGTYWDNDESACVPSPAFSCSDGWTENFNSGIDVFNDWFRYYDSVDNYQTHTVYGMLYIDGFKEGDFSDYNWGMGGDYLKSRYYLGDGSDDEVLEFVWKMRLNPIGFEDFGKSNAIMYLQNEEEDYIINIWRTGHFPGDGQPHNIVILEGYNTGVGWDELCVDGNCCPSCIFRDLTMYDTYKLVIDVAEQKYQVYLNDVLFDNFNNPGHPTVHDWRYYQGPGRLEKLSVVFGGNTLFEQTQNVSFDDFSASGGTCADLDLGHRICGDVSASGTDLPSACDTDLTDVAVFPNMNYYNFYCVYEGKNYS